MGDGNIIQVTPFMHVPDIETALAFMTGILGFGTDHREAGYAYVSRDSAGLRIMEAGPATPSGRARGALPIISIAGTWTGSTPS